MFIAVGSRRSTVTIATEDTKQAAAGAVAGCIYAIAKLRVTSTNESSVYTSATMPGMVLSLLPFAARGLCKLPVLI
jgi:hypothetical protein